MNKMEKKNHELHDNDMSFYSSEELEKISVFEAQLQFYLEAEHLLNVYLPLPDTVFQEEPSPQKDRMYEA